MYDPNDLSQSIREVAITLMEKMMAKLPDLKIPNYVNYKYTFALNYYPPKLPHFSTSEMALGFEPPLTIWFICR